MLYLSHLLLQWISRTIYSKLQSAVNPGAFVAAPPAELALTLPLTASRAMQIQPLTQQRDFADVRPNSQARIRANASQNPFKGALTHWQNASQPANAVRLNGENTKEQKPKSL